MQAEWGIRVRKGTRIRVRKGTRIKSPLTNCDQVWWVEEWNVCSVSVIDRAPGKVENFIFFFGCILAILLVILHVLNELDEWAVRMVQNQTAIH